MLPPKACNNFFLICLYSMDAKPGTFKMAFITGFSTVGNTELLNIFSTTRGTVISMYGLTSAKAFKSTFGDGTFA